MPEIVIVGADGKEHVFPDGFDPKRAAAIVRGGGTPEQKPATLGRPSLIDRVLKDEPTLPPVIRTVQGALRLAKQHPATAGATAAGIAATPLTGGMSLLPALATMGAASGLG